MREKNYGIEWLRILSMYMVAVLHTLGQGGILSSFQQGTLEYNIAWFLETSAYGAVDCFALISGYVGWHSHFSYRKGLRIWLQTFFYTIGITVLFAIFMPEAVAKEQWLGAFFPIMQKQYWYMTAYSGLFVLIPILNRAIAELSKKDLLRICLAIFVVFSLLPTVFNVTVFGLGGGYSVIWLMLLYILGGFWGRVGKSGTTSHGDRASDPKGPRSPVPMACPVPVTALTRLLAILIYLFCTAISFYLKLSGFSQYVSYTSPTILLGSCSLFFLFSSLKCGKISRKIAAFLAPSALSVYLIHVNPLVWNHIMLYFAVGHVPSGPILGIWVIGAAFGIYLVCTLIDLPRRGIWYLVGHIMKIKSRRQGKWH